MALEGVRAARGNNGPATVEEEVCTPPGRRADEHFRWQCPLKEYCAAKIPEYARPLVRVLSELGVMDVMSMLFEAMPTRSDWKDYSNLGYVAIRKVYAPNHMLFYGEIGVVPKTERKRYLLGREAWVYTDLGQGNYCMILGWLLRDAFKYSMERRKCLPSIARHFEELSKLNSENLGDQVEVLLTELRGPESQSPKLSPEKIRGYNLKKILNAFEHLVDCMELRTKLQGDPLFQAPLSTSADWWWSQDAGQNGSLRNNAVRRRCRGSVWGPTSAPSLPGAAGVVDRRGGEDSC